MQRILIAAFFALAAAFAGVSQAGTSFIRAADRTDMAYDFRRNVIYIANGDEVLRYSLLTRSFLRPLALDADAQTRGMDISADGYYLAVADLTSSADQAWVYLVDLRTRSVSKRTFNKDYYDGGTWSVAFTSDNSLLVTSDFNGSGWVPLRRLQLSDGTWSTLGSVRQQTMLSASADRQTIAFAEANISDGRWGLYDVPSGQLVERSGYDNGTSEFNYEIATDVMGGGFAVKTYGGLHIYDADYQRRQIITDGAGGVAWHPVAPLVYYPSANMPLMLARNVDSGVTFLYDMGESIEWSGEGAYANGRTKLSADGSLFMVTTPGGVRYQRTYRPLAAGWVSGTANSGVGTTIALKGSIGNMGTLTYWAHGQPRHGVVTVSGASATYTSQSGFKGTDSFRYMVRYGAAAYAIGTVSVTVK